ncbi:hypothetical protein HER10_EVM0009988 [Colletotrichum scovillei]|uniref:Concanavalin A-like lectin/glucanase n=1 Tax=Colletotrichum scovillei TaxID=1209932 RepID=A0A9P7U6L0_9PEZI|nr:uncharacterized protein HER10_EVM0009988 [Colletotrichum scovillei]KAF4781303.1 hypothetical protein HER10_EVM0009988 [Colletotrichum scovillei]KAG7039323.1 hypothetical protein JMJ78_0005117 [Colletotrichum scovillei]KAG7041503.1 hypothetical protein JMJ77_0003608 [Colletotrichum scovillei]KAG7061531.1 hypothetical protein JMJ76_0001094 [Colletotrichum scovillei]
MRSFSSIAVLPLAARIVAAGKYDAWKFGNMFTLGSDSSVITKATYTLVPPSIPCGTVISNKDDQPWMSIWVGISQSVSDQGSDLFQPLLNWAPDNSAAGCPASNTEWCVAASTFTGSTQVAQPYIAIPSKSDVDFELVYDASKGVTQKVWINGAMVSQQTDVDGNGKAPTYIYSSNECYQGACGTLPAYSWSNLTIVLAKADKTFGDSLQLTGATSTGIKTTDDGKTWHVDAIKINQDFFYTDGSNKQC